ncbi:helix-turn-helix transcriptional regulator [Pseudomonas sp. SBB6]|uniref:LexA family transcriptional regulator n=1 Tax=Pseudomonas sp. SBB6 TaxID=2962032 RepID=UPI0020B8BFC8|nr:helix-turn-helix transcriptional regulator [Pseudomonas sp. SBB6]MCP3750751.1 helix-turn-helix transcriptional regulator [Pseudomonas sp. SBB6]
MKKRPLPDARKDECLRLKAIFNAKKKDLGLTQEKLAHQLEMNQSSVSHYLNGINPLNAHVAAAFSRILKVPVREFSERLADEIEGIAAAASITVITGPVDSAPRANATMLGPISIWDDDTPLDDDEVYVPFLKEVELSAGSGRTVIEKSSTRKLRFGKLTLRNQGVQFDQAVCVTVRGNSMEPVLPDGSTVGVDKGSTAVKDGKMYAVDHGGELRVKTLYRIPGGGLRFRSFNQDEHPDEEYTAQQLAESGISVLGKVFWYSVLL